MIRTATLIVAVAACSVPALAQQPAPASGIHAMEIGPLRLVPRLEIPEIGVDDNVFNDPQNPQSDFTATIAPRLDALLGVGWTRLSFSSTVEFVYFKEFTDERSLNRSSEARFEVGEGLLRPYVHGSITDTHARFNAEVDARAGRRQGAYGGGLAVMVSQRTSIRAGARRTTLDFADEARYRGVDLASTLNAHTDEFDGGLRIAITPLTTWDITAARQQDRFAREPQRDADSVRIGTGLEFSPSALISGRASVGYRRFTPVAATLADYRGLVAQVGLRYALESTRLDVQVERDVRYSFEELEPYYLLTAGRVTATQRVAGPVDIQATIGRHDMAYRSFGGGPETSRRDWSDIYGGGVGWRMGETVRLGLNVEFSRRRSDTETDRRYERRRIYGSISYGL
jgi:hypothetical protein